MRTLFVAPNSNLQTHPEIIRAAQGMEVYFCDGLVDRQKLEQALYDEVDTIHFAGHGDMSVLALNDGPIEAHELLSMLRRQRHLSLVVITACHSTRVGSEIHNAMHVPVVLMQAEIGDAAAGRFSETFYRSLRAENDIRKAVDVARAALAKTHPEDADIVTLINGDMTTDAEMQGCMAYVKSQLGMMDNKLSRVEGKLEMIEEDVKTLTARREHFWTAVIVLIAILAISQTVATIFLIPH
jgi:hypothetical protein